jgi:iron complex transport system permease protein
MSLRVLARASATDAPAGRARSGLSRSAGLLLALGVLVLACLASIAIGSRDIPLGAVVDALAGRPRDPAELVVILDLRIPRTLVGLAAGLALGVAGALIQAVTRNPLADPGILGVTAGSAFAVAIATGVLGVTAVSGYLWFAFAGALVAAVVVYVVGSAGRGGGDPVRLTLAGVALGAVLAGITSGLLLADPQGFSAMRAWESGSLQDRGWDALGPVAPFLAAGVLLAALIARSLDAVARGDDHARWRGADRVVVRGLMIPHIARWIVGPDQRWILAYTIVLAPVLLLAADIVGRVVLRPAELPAGIVTAVLGAPVLILLVRRQRASAL